MHRQRLAALLAAALVASFATAGLTLATSHTLTVTPADTTITVGDTTNATASLSGYVVGDGTGTITIALFSDSGCATPVGSVTEVFGPVAADGSYGPLATGYATTAPGSLWWSASYSGDTNNTATTSSCVEVTVAKATPVATAIPADTTITVGDTTNASASLSGSYLATGTMTIALFSDSGCTVAVGSVTEGFTVAGDNTYGPLTTAHTTTAAGSLWWGASYDGDANNEADTDCVEVSVAKAAPSLTTVPSPTSVNPAPAPLSDTATLAGGYAPTGSIEFKLFPPSDPTCAGAAAYTETVTVNGNDDYLTTGTGTGSNSAGLAGVWNWTADYSGDGNNDPASSGCGAEQVPVYVDTTVVYAGQTYDADGGGTTIVSANLSSLDPACLTGDVTFTLTPVGGSPLTPIVVANTSPSTYAFATPALGSGIFQVDVAFDPTNAYCNPSSDAAVLTVVSPGDAANGGGWYRNLDFTPSRVNFGFTIQKQVNRKTGEVTYRGQLLWMNAGTDGWRLKGTSYSVGTPYAYGTFACPSFVGVPGTSNPRCGSFTGNGVLQRWDPTANDGLGGWVDSGYGAVTFTAIVYDGGSMNVCKGKRNCTKQDLADWFGIQVDPVPGTVIPESAPIMLRGGSIKVG